MKKIMFNDRYGLTQAVFDGRKTMTRRIISKRDEDWFRMQYGEEYERWERHAPFMYLEEVAVAQSYKSIEKEILAQGLPLDMNDEIKHHNGYNNKMFVKAVDKPHRIRITDIKVERLQDISDNDCIAEGIKCFPSDVMPDLYTFEGVSENWKTAREAFARLIDKVSGKDTWSRNPYVFAYTFELVKGGRS